VKLIVQPDAGPAPVVHAIRQARKIIDVCIFRFGMVEIERALANAVKRGVRVRALIAHTNRGGENRLRKLEQRLLAAGVSVSRSSDDLQRYHSKYMVADDTLHVWGFNFTDLDIEKSRSFGIATRDRRTVQEAAKLFEADCMRKPYSPSRSNLVVSPDTARETLANFIREARKELAIYDAKIQDPQMVRLLKQRASKGVRVRVIGTMKKPGGDVAVTTLKGLRLHVRAIVRDGTRAFVGSQSLRTDELENRREVGLIISNPKLASQLMKVFEMDWANSGGKSIKDDKAEKDKEKPKEKEAAALPA
jgi:cardiolipin synthase